MKIGEVALATGLGIQTIRFYEDHGLLPAHRRTEGGYRIFADADLERLEFIKKAKRVGLSLAEIKDVLVITDVQYPMSAMDMFWMEPEMALRTGQIPPHASTLESYLGRQWRRWSWHRPVTWVPGVDDLFSHWAIVEACWNREAKHE